VVLRSVLFTSLIITQVLVNLQALVNVTEASLSLHFLRAF
jgi:hypothetical protein